MLSCSWACGFSVLAATIIRSRSGASGTTTASRPSSPASAARRARWPTRSGSIHNRGSAQAQNPKTGENLKPTGLGSDPLDLTADSDPRHALVDWMSSADNPFFARALVNRYWKHFFGRGIVDPEDDMRVTNPASNPELLDGLSAALHQERLRPQGADPHDLQLAGLSARFRAQRLQSQRQAELLPLLSQAAERRSPAGRHQPGDQHAAPASTICRAARWPCSCPPATATATS